MDLIESGAIFNFKPPNGQKNRLKDDSISKPTSRFEELFLASPRAKELSSSADISSYLSSSTSFDQHNSQLFTPGSKCTTSDNLASSGFENSSTPSDTHSDLFTTLITSPDNRFAVLKSQVNDVINSLATPQCRVDSSKSLNRDSGLGDTGTGGNLTKSDNQVFASDSCDDNDNDMIPTCDDAGCDTNDSDGHHSNNTNIADAVENNGTDLQKSAGEEDEEDEKSLVDISSVDHNSNKADNGIEENDLHTDKTTEDKEPLPPSVSVDMDQPVVKKPHHLSEWCIKAVISKNNPTGVIVEGQRPEDKGAKWHSTTIAKRLDYCLLETQKQSCYVLEGEIEEDMTLEQGFSAAFVQAFKNGFPPNWEELVQEHFESFTSSPKKKHDDKKRTIQIVQAEKPKRTRHKTRRQSKVTPVEVELKRTSSGRLIKPPLAWWRGQRIVTDGQHNLTAIEPGGEEHTPLSIGLYDFDLKLPKNKQAFLQSKLMKPKVAKFDLRPDDKSNKTRKSKNNNKMAKTKVLECTSDDPSTEDAGKVKSKKRFSRILSVDNTQSDTNDSAVNTKLQSRNTRLQSRNQRITTRNAQNSKSSRTKYVQSLSSEGETTVDDDDEEARVENVKRNISFDDKAEAIDNSHTKIHNSSDHQEAVSPQKLHIKSYSKRESKEDIKKNSKQHLAFSKASHTSDDDSESITSQGSDAASYSKQTTLDRKPSETRNRVEMTNQNVQQRKEKKPKKAQNQQHTEISNDKEDFKENIISYDSEQSSSSDQEEAQAIANMVNKAKDRKEKRENQEKQEKQSSAPKKTTTNTNKKKPSSKDTTNSHESQWKDDEIMRFTKALHTIPLNSAQFWQRVAELVETHTAHQCQSKYEEQLEVKPKRENTKTKQAKPSQKVVAITGGVGTVKRKRELRQLIQQTNDGYDDDIFDSTPYKKSKTNFKILVQPCSSDDDDDDDNDFVEEQNNKDYKTPSSRTPSSRYRPLGPVSNSSNTPTAELISPSLLQPVNRAGMDYYIQRMKQGRRGFHTGGQNKKAKTSTPKKQLTVDIPKVTSSMFDIHEAPDHDSEDESDDYFSDE